MNLRFVVYCTAIKHLDKSGSDFLYHRLKNSKVETEGELMINVLEGCKKVINRDEEIEVPLEYDHGNNIDLLTT